jgi:hypothetical protein
MFTGFSAQPDSASTNEQLLKLYWNRASVKRELRALRRERHDLLDKLKEQEGANVRAREQLDGLEKLLTNPLAAANAMVYFQLRHLWRIGAQRVEQFARELQAQREKRERAQLHEAALAKRRRRLDAINERLQSLFQKRHRVAEELRESEHRLGEMNPLIRLFQGPRSKRKIRGLNNGLRVLESRIEEFKELTEKIEGEPLPEPDGLSLESRRMINTAVVALAQHLVLHFSEHDLASLAKTATQRPVGDMKFGDRRDCDRMVERIREMIEELRQQKDLSELVKRRADFLLATSLRYRNETDSVPMMESLETITPRISKDQGSHTRRASDAPLRINILADDYWDIFNVLR